LLSHDPVDFRLAHSAHHEVELVAADLHHPELELRKFLVEIIYRLGLDRFDVFGVIATSSRGNKLVLVFLGSDEDADADSLEEPLVSIFSFERSGVVLGWVASFVVRHGIPERGYFNIMRRRKGRNNS